jgi:hypothetical protein
MKDADLILLSAGSGDAPVVLDGWLSGYTVPQVDADLDGSSQVAVHSYVQNSDDSVSVIVSRPLLRSDSQCDKAIPVYTGAQSTIVVRVLN